MFTKTSFFSFHHQQNISISFCNLNVNSHFFLLLTQKIIKPIKCFNICHIFTKYNSFCARVLTLRDTNKLFYFDIQLFVRSIFTRVNQKANKTLFLLSDINLIIYIYFLYHQMYNIYIFMIIDFLLYYL